MKVRVKLVCIMFFCLLLSCPKGIASMKDEVHSYYYESQVPLLVKLDHKTIGEPNWILGKKSRDFRYIKLTSAKMRAEFAVGYKFFLFDHDYLSVFAKGDRNKNSSEYIVDGTYYDKMRFVPFNERAQFAKKWWLENNKDFQRLVKESPEEADCWIRESLMDAYELNYRCFDLKKTSPKEKAFYSRKHRFNQLIVLEQLEIEPNNFRKQIEP